MKFLIRLFAAFCVATVLAEVIILGLCAFRGNLSKSTAMQAVALLNGIDITGQRLEKILTSTREAPTPTAQEVAKERASQDLNLDMRERSLRLFKDQLDAKEAQLKLDIVGFENRVKSFYGKLDELAKGQDDQGLKKVQRTLEAASPEQAKVQLLKMIEDNQLKDVVAIINGMQPSKTKKIIEEFATPSEQEKFFQILMGQRKGDPGQSDAIQKAR
jgi:hypothetical protein